MKKIIKVSSMLFLLLGILNIRSNDVLGAVVNIPDQNFKACLNNALKQAPTDDITDMQLASLSFATGTLRCEVIGIQSIEGAQYLTGLDNLFLSRNNISDLSPVSGLTNLRAFSFDGNNASDISALSGLTNLEYINMAQNNISDLSPLSNLKKIDILSAGFNDIEDISVLSDLTNIERLYISHNNISDISPLTGLTKLFALDIGYNQISDITPLSNITTLKDLGLNGNIISDITPLSSLINLESLALARNKIEDISALNGLPLLLSINISFNHISDISVLETLPSLLGIFAEEQTITLDDNVVGNDNYQLTFDIYDENGNIVAYEQSNSYTLNPGINSISNTWTHNFRGKSSNIFSGTVVQQVEYNNKPVLTASDFTSNIGLPLSDAEIIKKSGASAFTPLGDDITNSIVIVDRGGLDENKEGVYLVDLYVEDSSGLGTTLTINVTIKDTNETLEEDENDLPEGGLSSFDVLFFSLGFIMLIVFRKLMTYNK